MNHNPRHITRQQREAANGHRGGVIYFTGLSVAGKSTIARLTEAALHERGLKVYVLDGDELRSGICKDLGYSDADRLANMRRAVEVARLMVDAGLVVITALISPFRAEREAARARFSPDEFVEVYVDAPLAVCEARDPKGLYRRARSGEIRHFTGLDSPYEPPLAPEVHIDTTHVSAQEAADRLVAYLALRGFMGNGAEAQGAAAQFKAVAPGAHAGAHEVHPPVRQ